ncbi:hypothetical protein EXIGLDRAFT_805550 [Exidia glandulosa HHB12029]|uniref:3'-5' exonuclease domain-containing protein n=1 Tax=Exidia glandulosa HHB12029 TaxID=1314781 RepID=A0A165DLU8_EXIGL|nr:hypothetical protein EXIGLDRAFT_805550 [Exidia glandulosa HHB12029]
MSYELCAMAAAAARAVRNLQSSSHIFVDLEGRKLGCEEGALSVISVGTALARKVYVFDVLSLNMADVQPLLDLIANQETLKIVWDGRKDAIELRRTFGPNATFGRVLDLQVANVVSRPDDEIRKYRARHPLNLICHYDTTGVHALTALKSALGLHGVQDNFYSRNQPVFDHNAWMDRPLPRSYLDYAANDISLISRVYSLFQQRGYVSSGSQQRPELEVQSSRYINMHLTPIPKDDAYRMSSLMPLEILSVPDSNESTRRECTKCHRSLSVASFTYRVGPTGSRGATGVYDECKVCYLLSERRRLQEEESTRKGLLRA